MTQSKVAPKVVSLNAFRHAESGPSGDPLDLTNPVTYCVVSHRFNREWAPALSSNEFRLLSFILDQTVGWGRAGRHFTYRLFMHGDRSETNIKGTAGIGLTERPLRQTLHSLEVKGVIHVDRSDLTKGLMIRPNLNWNPEDIMLPVPKRLQVGDSNAVHTQDGWSETPAVDSPTPRLPTAAPSGRGQPPFKEHSLSEHSFQEQEDYSDRPGSEGPVSSLPIPVRVRRRPVSPPTLPAKREPPQFRAAPPYEPELPLPSARREFSLEEAAADRRRKLETVRQILKPRAIETTYRAAFEEAYSDQPGVMPTKWTVEQHGIINSAVLKKWLGTPEECHEYVDWLVRNFYRLRKTAFGWMKKPAAPVAPDVKFIARWHTNLLAAYHERKQESWLESIDNHELRNFKRMTTVEGKTDEEARMKLAENRVTSTLREEMIQREAAAANEFRAGQIAKARAAKTPMGVHPRSEIAKRLRELEARIALPLVDPDEPIDLMAALEAGEKLANEGTDQ